MSLLKRLNLMMFFDGAGAAVIDAGAAGGGGDNGGGAGGEGGAGGGDDNGAGGGAGEGAGDGNGGEGGGAGGGENGGDAPAGTGKEDQERQRQEETPEAKIEREEKEAREREEDEQLYERDGRKVDDATKKLIANLKKSNPVAAKKLADEHFHRKAFEAQFPTVQEARSARAVMDSVGGVEGIGRLQTEVKNYRSEITQFQNGDKALIEGLYAEDPQGIIKAGTNIFNLLKEKNPEHFEEAFLPHFSEVFDGTGVLGNVKSAMDLLTKAEGQKAFDLLNAIINWDHKLHRNVSERKRTTEAMTPERKKLEDDRAKFNKETEEHGETTFSTSLNETNNRNMARTVDSFFNEMKLPVPGRKAFVTELYRSIHDAMREDKTFQDVHQRIKESGDKQRRLEFVSEKFKELLPDHFEQMRNSLYPSYKAKPRVVPSPVKRDGQGGPNRNGGAGAGAGGGSEWKVVSEPPRPQDVDQTKTTDMMMIGGKYILKNGSRIHVK